MAANLNLAGMMGVLSSRSVFQLNAVEGDKVVSASDMRPGTLLMITDCKDGQITVNGNCAKISVQDCSNVHIIVAGKVLSETAEMMNCQDMRFTCRVPIGALQVDGTATSTFKFEKKADFGALVWANCQDLTVLFGDDEADRITTGRSIMQPETEEAITITTQFKIDISPATNLLTVEPIVRLESGYPSNAAAEPRAEQS